MQDLNDLFYFAKVVELGGFSAAARAPGVPKSRLSRRVAGLEAMLDARLLQRTTRRLTLTEVGGRYLEHCRVMLAAAESAQETISHALAAPSGVLRVSAPVALAERQLAPVLPEFMKRYPAVTLDLLVVNRRVDPVAEGIDVALRVRLPPEQDAQLVTRQLFESPMWLVAAPALLRRQAPHVHAAAVGREFHRAARSRARRPCAVCLPALYCEREVAARKLVRLLPDWALPVNVTHAVYPTRLGLSPAVRAFVDFLASRLPVKDEAKT